ncbi:MAG: hypothetical protein O3B95_10110 [Chloroflexi bacterium]|nr:hypothetical protein [Chloroflexota bacterium]
MARRIIRRRRPSSPQRGVIRRSGSSEAAFGTRETSTVEPVGVPVLLAMSSSIRSRVLPKLANMKELSLSGAANTPAEAVNILIRDHPDVVMLDIDFGGPLEGLDLAKMMQKTRPSTAIVMLVSDIDATVFHGKARRFGTSWSYLRRNSAARAETLESTIKSAIRGVQWIDPELTRPLSQLWKVASEARDLESKRVIAEPAILKNARTRKPVPVLQDDEEFESGIDDDLEPDEADNSPGDGLKITSITVGNGGIGQRIGSVRKAE